MKLWGHATPAEKEEVEMPKVLVSDPISEAGIEKMRAIPGVEVDVKLGLKPDELKAIIGEYAALAVRSETKVTADILSAATQLQIIGRAGVGVDNIDVAAATQKGIVVVNSPEGNTLAAAELAVALLLALARKIPQADASLRAGKWERKKFVGTEIYGKTVGVIGLGKIGRSVASISWRPVIWLPSKPTMAQSSSHRAAIARASRRFHPSSKARCNAFTAPRVSGASFLAELAEIVPMASKLRPPRRTARRKIDRTRLIRVALRASRTESRRRGRTARAGRR